MKFGGEVELVSGLEQFRAAISSPAGCPASLLDPHVVIYYDSIIILETAGLYLSYDFIYMKEDRKLYINLLCLLKVDVDECPAVASSENVRVLPTFKIYKQGSCMKEVVSPNPEVLESLVRHYTI
ncbi:hypothetical protein HAX54_045040 [Datura stramonium]|uniref:Thioredoxin domain-containing protein n=1 Tax=Datura stramonium TaxID=4076 RepID=A0ABS8WK56_DATST|nr:hypothetical protein [Datura stramonium]